MRLRQQPSQPQRAPCPLRPWRLTALDEFNDSKSCVGRLQNLNPLRHPIYSLKAALPNLRPAQKNRDASAHEVLHNVRTFKVKERFEACRPTTLHRH